MRLVLCAQWDCSNREAGHGPFRAIVLARNAGAGVINGIAESPVLL
jgi:hypothetical protein